MNFISTLSLSLGLLLAGGTAMAQHHGGNQYGGPGHHGGHGQWTVPVYAPVQQAPVYAPRIIPTPYQGHGGYTPHGTPVWTGNGRRGHGH